MRTIEKLDKNKTVLCHCKEKGHGDYIAEVFLINGQEFKTTCPKCIEKFQEEVAKKDESFKNHLKVKELEKMNIEKEYFNATFENFRAETQSQKEALNYFLKMKNERHGKLLLLGSNGCGKTHLGCSLVKELGGAIYSMYEITTRIRQSYTTLAEESELQIVRELANLPCLVIDEIGRTKNSDAERNWLSYIIDKRHVRNLPTVLISNRKLARTLPTERQNEAIENFFENDIISRFQQDTGIIQIEGKDARRNIAV